MIALHQKTYLQRDQIQEIAVQQQVIHLQTEDHQNQQEEDFNLALLLLLQNLHQVEVEGEMEVEVEVVKDFLLKMMDLLLQMMDLLLQWMDQENSQGLPMPSQRHGKLKLKKHPA